MTALFEFPLADETLNADELHRITGCARAAAQAEWLTEAGWVFHKNRAREPIVGRLYARLKMAGIEPKTLTTGTTWEPDFSKMR